LNKKMHPDIDAGFELVIQQLFVIIAKLEDARPSFNNERM